MPLCCARKLLNCLYKSSESVFMQLFFLIRERLVRPWPIHQAEFGSNEIVRSDFLHHGLIEHPTEEVQDNMQILRAGLLRISAVKV